MVFGDAWFILRNFVGYDTHIIITTMQIVWYGEVKKSIIACFNLFKKKHFPTKVDGLHTGLL